MSRSKESITVMPLTNFRPDLTFTNCLPNFSFSGPGSNPGSYISFTFHVSLISSNQEYFSYFFSSHWHFWRILANYFVKCSSIGICLMFSHDLIKVMQFWQQYHMNNALCAVHPISRYMMSTCIITSNVNFDHLIKGMPARFLQCKVLFFPL